MKKILISTIYVLLFLGYCSSYKDLIIENIDNKPVRIIKVILDWEDFIVSSIAFTWWDTLENLTKNVWWDTSINWAFFCPNDYSYCNWITHTISERVFLWEWKEYSKYRGDTWIRWIFGFKKDWEPIFVQKNAWNVTGLSINTNAEKIDQIYFWLWNFPVLLINWEDVKWWSEHLFDKKMKSKWNKHFICSTKDNYIIYMWVVWNIDMYELPKYLKENFDCWFAINLDAGMSAWMIYDWNVLQRWWRREIMDAFVVLDKYEYAKLTDYIPPQKQKYQEPNKYIQTSKDITKIKYLKSILYKAIQKYWDEIRRKFIEYLRKQVSLDITTEQNKSIYKELLLYLFTIDKL